MTSASPRERAEWLVNLILGERLADAREPPGVREAVIREAIVQSKTIEQRLKEQMRELRSPSSTRVPDAYFADEEDLENALQHAAAGIRSALAREGFLTADARWHEAGYASLLAQSARWAILEESSRVPRPPTRHRPLAPSLAPIPWQNDEDEWPPPVALELAQTRSLTGKNAEPVRVEEAPYADWVQLGLFEQQATLSSTHPKRSSRALLISTGLEVSDSPVPADSMPAGTGPPNIWLATYDYLLPGIEEASAGQILKRLQGPLTGMVSYQGLRGAPDRRRGVGVQPYALVPRAELVAFLDLRPESPSVRHCLVDGQRRPALVGRSWRGFLVHDGGYSPLVPAVQGSDLIVRPDLYERIEAAIGKNRIRSGIAVHHFEGEDDDTPDD